MPRKKKTAILPEGLNQQTLEELEGEWYTAGEAARSLAQNNGREHVVPSYVAKLASRGLIRSRKIHERLSFYYKEDVDNYKLETRQGAGKRVGAAKREQHGRTGPTVREQRRAKKMAGGAA